MTTESIDLTEGLVPVLRPTFHFYVHNALEFRSGTDLHTLMRWFDREKRTYWVWYVPCKHTVNYDINLYRPQVEGSFVLEQVVFDDKGKLQK
jgi:hypothetical protein